jgi:uncharacterized membrane protein
MGNRNTNLAPTDVSDPDRHSPAHDASTSASILSVPRSSGPDDRSDAEAGAQPPVGRAHVKRRIGLSTRQHPHPALVRHAEERARSLQNRIADTITSYAGSMRFVYAHIALFAVWMIWLEKSPWPTLTLVVSLEAIFLSTFVMISQNRADEKRAVIAGEGWESVQLEEKQNEELLHLSQQILALTDEIHELTVGPARGNASTVQPPASSDRMPRRSRS